MNDNILQTKNEAPGASVQVRHHFTASVEEVFDVWIKPELAKQFLFATPKGNMIHAETEPRAGGSFVFTERRDGVDVVHTGKYLELDRPRRLAFSFIVPLYSSEATVVIIDFIAQGSECDLILTHRGIWAGWEEKTIAGWEMMLGNLAKAL